MVAMARSFGGKDAVDGKVCQKPVKQKEKAGLNQPGLCLSYLDPGTCPG